MAESRQDRHPTALVASAPYRRHFLVAQNLTTGHHRYTLAHHLELAAFKNAAQLAKADIQLIALALLLGGSFRNLEICIEISFARSSENRRQTRMVLTHLFLVSVFNGISWKIG